MRTRTVIKAGAITPDQPIADATLVIGGDADKLPNNLKEIKKQWQSDAKVIMEVLRSLPGGTKKELLSLLLAEHSNLLKIPDNWPPDEEVGE